jgi:uncharacterized protein YecE (DUF72 family)
MHPTDDSELADSANSRPLADRLDEVAQFVFNLMTRANNIERHAGKLEEQYYRLHGQLNVVEDGVRSLNNWKGRMEAQQAALSPFIRFGTSTWAYEGWQGLVYHNAYDKRRFKQDCLAEYARYGYHGEPLFRTVGLDLSFYGPPTVELLTHYAKQLPTGFEMCSKVWEEITIPRFADHPRYGAKAGQPNPRFLDAKVFVEEVLPPYEQVFKGHIGPFMFEFQRTGLIPSTFLPRLDTFLSQLPTRYRYAIEVRNPLILTPQYKDILTAHGAAHVYNHWTAMPPLAHQHRKLTNTFTAQFAVLRLLTPLGISYEAAVKRAEPYNRIIQELPDMRADTIALVKQAVAQERTAYVLVNNRSEGSAPLTVQALVDQLKGINMPMDQPP